VTLRAETIAQGNGVQLSLRKKREMFRRVKVRESSASNNFFPFIMRQFKSVFTINGLPYLIFGGFRIQNESIEVEDESLDPPDCCACPRDCFACHNLKIIPERLACYTLLSGFQSCKELTMKDLYYSDYIELDRILDSQHPRSFESMEKGNDEMLFIIIHQVYELWFKQILFELDLVRHIFIQNGINDNSDDMSKVVHKLKRIGKILELINQQVGILETMTALDFLEFRNVLLPASGFQSKQFRLMEAKLGLKMEQRYKTEYYKHTRRGSLSESDLQEVNQAESESTLKELIIKWLERMPYLDDRYWKEYKRSTPQSGSVDKHVTESEPVDRHKFWVDYRIAYQNSLSENEAGRLRDFDKVFFEEGRGDIPPAAMQAALFITIYRNLPIFQMPFELLNTLSEIDELLSNWRYRHFMMVRRMIGLRVGTGGTSGAGYLEGTLSQHYAFREITEVATFLIERSKRPVLPNALKEKVSFNL
jgi:tryptophan 2,3-dioxygenase